jgi:hypothetical protein
MVAVRGWLLGWLVGWLRLVLVDGGTILEAPIPSNSLRYQRKSTQTLWGVYSSHFPLAPLEGRPSPSASPSPHLFAGG